MSFREALKKLSDDFIVAMNSGDAAGCAAVYAEDALVYYSTSAPVRGRDEIRRIYGDAIAQGQRLKALTLIHADSDENIGYGIQSYEGSNGSGMVMFAMRKGSVGDWLITTEAFIAP